jgi:kynurenine formamidase
MGGHTGTHIDALGHYAKTGHVFGNEEKSILEFEGYTTGLQIGGVERTPPIFGRGVLLDIARLHGLEVLPANHEIGPEDLEAALFEERITLKAGDVLLIRTGWMQYWGDQKKYCGITPGVNQEGAYWIGRHGIGFAGCDTSTFEKIDQT